MKLIGDLCELIKCEAYAKGIEALVKLNPSHAVFAAHFPGYPVTPGVIQMQLVSEVLGHQLRKKIFPIEVDYCKFMAVVNPERTPLLTFHIEIQPGNEQLLVTATGETSEGVFLKLKGRYRLNA